MSDRTIAPSKLQAIAENILIALGTPRDIASEVAESLVGAQIVGHDSHGVIRLVEYADFVDRAVVHPAARAHVVSGSGATAVIDGGRGWGQSACRLAVATVDELARTHGTATVTVRDCNHIGRIGEYVESLALAGLVGIAWCNAEPAVAPYGGKARMLGTNPFAAGIPFGTGQAPMVLDFATAATAEGKLRVAMATGEPIAPGLVIDVDGVPAQTPEAFYDGGALVPFGGHKGYGLNVMIEMLGGALSGNHPSTSPDYTSGNGVVLIAFDPEFFVGRDSFVADTARCASELRASAAVAPDQPVLLPGDVENRTREARSVQIPIAAEIWRQLSELADRLGTTISPSS